jgi:hypothetical protein
MEQKNRKLIKLREIDDGIYKTNVYGVKKDGIVLVVIYKGNLSLYKRIWDKKVGRDWFYVVKYEKNSTWAYEHFTKFADARKRAFEIAEAKTK